MIGKTILHYKILEKLGEGGMGVVYKAEDTKLDRIVAIKLLPAHLLTSADDRSRFNREAKAAAALNHPNIATVYEINEYEGKPFIVMEYVEGKTLNDALEKELFKLKDAVSIAIQVAEGLKAAHAKNIVHRDIKSGNVLLSNEGQAKILDFGLAKTAMSTKLTKMGSTLGTVAYMSPEQVSTQSVDHRTDLWSLGVVIFEMLTGRFPFSGEYDQAIFYNILNEPPEPLTAIRSGIPMSLEWIVNKLLAKNPDERYQNANDLIIDLKAVDLKNSGFSRTSQTAISTVRKSTGQQANLETSTRAKTHQPKLLKRIMLAGSFLTVAILSALISWNLPRTPTEMQTIRAFIPLPERTVLNNHLGGGHVTLSHDGKKIAFVATDSAGRSNLWVRSLDALDAQMLSGTEGALFPFWSPDGKTIAFVADRKLKRIDASGGTPFAICDDPSPRGGSWGKTGVIIFAPSGGNNGIYQVSAAGGTPEIVTKLDSTRNEATHRWPVFLPDGDHFLFFIRTTAAGSGSEADSICVGSIKSGEVKHLFHGVSDAAYAGGQILFIRESALMAQPFNLAKLAVSGEAVPIAQQIQYDSRFSRAAFSVSQNGLLLYQSTGTRWTRELALFNNKGDKIRSFGQLEVYRQAQLSNDEKRIAMEVVDLQSHNVDLWLYDIARGIRTRFTFDPQVDAWPLWSPDGSRIVFSSNRKVHSDLYIKATSGAAPEELLTDFGARDKHTHGWSSDGRYILVESTGDPKTKADLWILPMTGDRKPIPFLQSEFDETGGAFSPDTRWIAYASDESGRDEVYVRPFVPPTAHNAPPASGKWQVSANGGFPIKWRNDGKGLFFAQENKIMLAEVRTIESNFEILGVTEYIDLPEIEWMDLSSDGKMLLGQITPSQEKSEPLTLVINWEDLEKK